MLSVLSYRRINVRNMGYFENLDCTTPSLWVGAGSTFKILRLGTIDHLTYNLVFLAVGTRGIACSINPWVLSKILPF